eukprot:463546_1
MATQKRFQHNKNNSNDFVISLNSIEESKWTCTTERMTKFVKWAFKNINQQHKNRLSQYETKIKQYFKKKQIDGDTFHNMSKHQFFSDIYKYINSPQKNKKQIKQSLNALHSYIQYIHDIPRKNIHETASVCATPVNSPPPSTPHMKMGYKSYENHIHHEMASKMKYVSKQLQIQTKKQKKKPVFKNQRSVNRQDIDKIWMNPHKINTKTKEYISDISFRWKTQTD